MAIATAFTFREETGVVVLLSLRIFFFFRWGRVVVVEFLFALRLGNEEEKEKNRTLGGKTEEGGGRWEKGGGCIRLLRLRLCSDVTNQTDTREAPYIYTLILFLSLSFFLCIAPSSSSSLNKKFQRKNYSPPKTIRTLFF